MSTVIDVPMIDFTPMSEDSGFNLPDQHDSIAAASQLMRAIVVVDPDQDQLLGSDEGSSFAADKNYYGEGSVNPTHARITCSHDDEAAVEADTGKPISSKPIEDTEASPDQDTPLAAGPAASDSLIDGNKYYESINDDHGRRIDNGMSKSELRMFKGDENLTASETQLANYLFDNFKLFDADNNGRLSRDEFLKAFDSAIENGGIGQIEYSGYQHGPYQSGSPNSGENKPAPDADVHDKHTPDHNPPNDANQDSHDSHGSHGWAPPTSEAFNSEVDRLLGLMNGAELKRGEYNPASVKLMAHLQELENLTGVDMLDQFATINDQVVAKEAQGTGRYAPDVEALAQKALVGWLEAAKDNPSQSDAIMEHIASVFSYSIHTSAAAKAGEHAHHMGNTAGYSLLHAFQTSRDGPIKQDILDIPNNSAPFTAEGVYDSVMEAGVDVMLSAAKQDGYFRAAHGTDPQNYNDNLPTHKDTKTMLDLSGYIS